MVYLAELLVVMTDRLKIARIRARYVPRVHGHMHLEDEFLASLSLSLQESDGVACWCAEVPSCWNIKKSSSRMSGSGLWARKLSRQYEYALFTMTPNLSNLIVTNPVLGKNLEHSPLTR